MRLRDEAGAVSATLGERLRVARGTRLVLDVTVTAQTVPNSTGEIPRLAHVDVIRGAVTGPAADATSWRAPDARVVESVDVSDRTGTFTVSVPLVADASSYVRLRGSDGKHRGVGLLGADIDPAGPTSRPRGDGGSPWDDLWFYTNPIFVDVV